MPGLSDRVPLLRISPIRRVTALLDAARKKTDIVSFGGGAPSLPPAREVLEEMCLRLQQEPLRSSTYTGTKGLPELRQLISEDIKKYGMLDYSGEKEIIVTDGGTEAIFSLFMAVLNKNDEVIILDPTYLGYNEAIGLSGGRVRTLQVNVKNGYQPDLESLKNLITERTKAFILLSPDNPTGRVISKEFVKGLTDLASDHDFWIVSDDTYKHIIYEGEHVWVAGYSGARERTIMLCSFSKEASAPGLRLGYALAPSPIIDAMEKMKQYTSLAPATLSQYGMMKFLSGDVKERYLREEVIPLYKERRGFMDKCIQKYLPEARTVRPAGAFYYFVDMGSYLSKMHRGDEGFCSRLLYRKNVAVIPGSFFGKGGEEHVRMTFVSEPKERIELGIKAIGEYVFSYTF
jgi:aspartate aminotransferase